ncbi:MAG: glycosyltransferase 87 family protein [Actinobacteria bacterium]|nr:glycosyltransferase 87 family protein [Actinomycetota bacterium]MCL5447466.1 glycosyltransferase 87 family protein [Actinomycetota bacterium]
MLARYWKVLQDWFESLEPESRDAIVYGASALFAFLTILISSIPLYRQWGEIAIGPYLAGTLWCFVVAWRRRRRMEQDAASGGGMSGRAGWKRGWSKPRVATMVIVMAGATFLPLALETYWQNASTSTSSGTTHAQPEVLVVEKAGRTLLKGHDPYTVSSKQPGGHISVPAGQPSYDVFFPYLPGMAIFGMPSGSKAPRPLGDARVMFALLTFVVLGIVLWINGLEGERGLLAVQAMSVLPFTALPLSTGGDDIPVIALMLLGLVLMRRHKMLMAGVAFGAAASLKFTSWPLVVIALLVLYAAYSFKDSIKAAAGAGLVVVPAVLPVALANMKAFVVNVVLYPLGLAGIRSPAASPMPGHLLVSTLPAIHHSYSIVVVLAGGVVFLAALTRWFPRDAGSLASFIGWAFLFAVLLAPTTRFGYLIYPFDLIIWSRVLHCVPRQAEGTPTEATKAVHLQDTLVGAQV